MSPSRPAPPRSTAPNTVGPADGTPSAAGPSPEEHLAELRLRVREAIAAGQLDDALELCGQAIESAQDLGDLEALDQARCNRAGILIARGDGEPSIRQMRQILMRSTSAANKCQAAYNISKHHDSRRETERATFYARLAIDHADRAELPELIAPSHNNLANILMLDSHFEQACGHYRRALGAAGAGHDAVERAIVLANLGYCQTVLGNLGNGFDCLTRSLRMLRRLGAASWRHLPHLGLSYAYLEIARYRRATEHAERALELAEAAGDGEEHVKNALYLLGEAAKLGGQSIRAYEHFSELQRRFYPNEPFVVDVLMAADIRKLINLMASS
ncbi:MAG: hypothetical protein AAGN66_25930 [Acidobacteriota bacterium]